MQSDPPIEVLDAGLGTARRIAALDLGTNSFHVVIVDVAPDGSWRTVDALKEMVQLGRHGVGRRLDSETMDRGISVLAKFKTLCDSKRVEHVLAYATSAIREAENGGEFIQRAIDEVGIKIQAIPGKTEAELIGYAVQHALELGDDRALVMDIGGGSTEFIIANGREFFYLDSRKIGVSRMSADFVKSDPVTKKCISDLESFYARQLMELDVAVLRFNPTFLVGTSGTMQNIAAMIAMSKKLDTSVTLNAFEYSADDFFAFYSRFVKLSRKQRLTVPGLDPKRVDFIVAGLVLVNFILKKYRLQMVKTSTQAMREGIILRYIRQELPEMAMLSRFPDTRTRSVHELLFKCNWHEAHSTQVSRLALELFDQTQALHAWSQADRELLHFAALMHDIGYHISHSKHHKHALYLILNADLKGFTQEEIEIMANVARYHRRSTPKARHRHFDVLKPEQKTRIRALSGFLRVADGLDRSHFQNVNDVRVVVSDKIYLYITTSVDPQLEIWGAMRKSELFEKLFGKSLEIRKVDSLDEVIG